jgi:glyoxylase-like metal-dependent hydrolase (beta-lactamase superfamily II)/ferredoxin
MARLEARLAGNVPGDFYVDDSCIDCAMCRIVAPAIFRRDEALGLSVVACQPEGDHEGLRAAMALVSCPTSSIGAGANGSLKGSSVKDASRAFPERMEDDVYFCGYASEKSYGASSYFIVRPAPIPGGNVLVDSPRAAKPLMDRIEELGGVRLLFLSHKDDVADHAKYTARFGCERIMHAADGAGALGVERVLHGGNDIRLADDLLAIPLPGHTRGSMALLYKEKFLFTGDHLWGKDDGSLGASRGVAWYSWAEQTSSMERLLSYTFEWVLPGHGAPLRAESPAAMKAKLEALVARMQGR